MTDGREDQRPWDKWFWADWAADTGLRLCSLAAKGLWIEMLAIMAKSKIKGFLLDGESKMESKTLAELERTTEDEIERLLAELFSHGVPSKDMMGVIYNRRMAREGRISAVRSEAGKLGGRPKDPESKTKAKKKADRKAPSAYASASDSDSSRGGGEGEGEKKPPAPTKEKPKTAKERNAPYHDLAELLKERVQENVPFQKISANYLDEWAGEFRLMIENDKVPPESLRPVLDWATTDSFWKLNIRSAATFRKQYGQLEAKTREALRGTPAQRSSRVGTAQPKFDRESKIRRMAADIGTFMVATPEGRLRNLYGEAALILTKRPIDEARLEALEKEIGGILQGMGYKNEREAREALKAPHIEIYFY